MEDDNTFLPPELDTITNNNVIWIEEIETKLKVWYQQEAKILLL